MTNPLSAVLNKLDSEWRCDDLSGEEATSAFRAVAMIAVAEHDAAIKAMENWRTDSTDSHDWEKRYRTLAQDLLDQQHYTTDREVVSSTLTITSAAVDFLAALDDKKETR